MTPGEFPAAPLDRVARLVTFGAGILLAVIVTLAAATPGGAPATAVVLAGAFTVPVLSFGFAPAGYRVGSGLLEVRRQLFGTRRFPLAGEVVRAPSEFVFGGIRLLGSGGFFGWYGTFWRRGVGRYLAYVTDRGKLVACTTQRGLVLVSPADPDDFVQAARRNRA